ncbi:MAG: hypothetical protein ACK2UY_14715 [Anaerolineae bacterium]
MTTELWSALAAALLAAAAASSGLALFGVRGPWRRTLVAARAASLVLLAVALGLAISAQGEPSPFDLRQLALALGLAMIIASLGLAWRRDTDGAGPVQDLVAGSLVLAAGLAIRPGGTPLTCAQRSLPFAAYWGLLILGAGALLLAGSTVLDLGLAAIVRRGERRLPPADAAFLGLVAVGGGLAISAWWSWRTMGSLLSGDARQVWLAATWLVASMGLLAWPLERQGRRAAAILALVAAVMALVGLLAIPELQRMWGL